MRLVAGAALTDHGISGLSGEFAIAPAAVFTLEIGLGLLLLGGLWTPVAGTLVAILDLAILFVQRSEPWIHILRATLGAALALVGPGAWSIDARLFGWRRIDFRDQQRGTIRPSDRPRGTHGASDREA